jgi:predicted SAM-dependent methyltransferase
MSMKLHLGCGRKFIQGYVHIDIVPYDHIDHVSSIDNLSFIETDSVDVIYTCHVLEHFKRNQTKVVLDEWFRVLKPNGTLRLAVPDFESICNVYQDKKDLNLIIGPLFGKQNYLYNIHYNIFDFKTLSKLLSDVGFKNIERYDPFFTEHSNVDDFSMAYIPHMDFKNGTCISLNIEAKK